MTIPFDASDALARGFAKHLAAIAKRSGAPAEVVSPLEHAAYRASLACAAGSVCIPLGELLHSGKDELDAKLEPPLKPTLEPPPLRPDIRISTTSFAFLSLPSFLPFLLLPPDFLADT